jgi:apolipoprotein N-acyltransferase
VLPFLSDRLLAERLPGFASTLIFPLTWVVVEFIGARTNPFGTWGSLAYTQYGNLPLMQLASVTGIWGIGFLIAWLGSTANWVWERNFEWQVVAAGVLTYVVVWGLVMLAGGLRLALGHSQAKTVRVAAIGWPEGVLSMNEVMRIFEPQLPKEEVGKLRLGFQSLQDWFLENAQREAIAGARIVLWPEANLMVFAADEAAFLERARQLARDQNIYLLMGMGTFHPGQQRSVENKAVLLNPSGEVAFSYIKTRPVPGQEAMVSIPGDGRIRTSDSPYGRLAAAICFDMDFPQLLQQVGRTQTDLLLVPASDWETIKDLHYQIAVFRAIENGVSLVRASRWGVSGAVDANGRALAQMDHFTADQRIMVAQVPTAGVRTLYARVGDLFAWLCLAGLLAAIAISVIQGIRPI